MTDLIHWFNVYRRPFCDKENVQFQKYPDSCVLMFNATLYMYSPTCYEFRIHFPFIFPPSFCFSLVFLFLPLFSLVVGYNFFVCFFLPNVFGTVISGVSCTLANNWAKLFCTGGKHLFEDGCYSNVYSTCVRFN